MWKREWFSTIYSWEKSFYQLSEFGYTKYCSCSLFCVRYTLLDKKQWVYKNFYSHGFLFCNEYIFKNISPSLIGKDVAGFEWCNGYGMLLLIYCFAYGRLIYNHGLKIFLAYSLKTFCHSCIILLQNSRKRR